MLRTRILLALGAGVPAALFVTAVVLLAIRIWAEWQHLPGHRIITADTFRLADPHPDRRVARAVAGVWREWSRELFLGIALAGLWPVVRLMPWQGLLGRIGRRDLARRGSAGWIGRARLRRAGMLTRTPLAAPRPLIAVLPGGFFTGPRWVMPPGDEPHVFVCAPTGAGKSTGIAIPTLLGLTGSAIVLDVKDGELMRLTAARRRAMGQRVLLFAPWRDAPVPDGIDVLTFNPLDRVTDETDGEVRYARAAQLAAALVPDARDSTQSWIPFARRLAGAAMLGAVALHALARRSRGVRDRDGMLHEAGIDPAALGALAACPAPTLGHAHDLLLTGGPVRGGQAEGGQAEGGQAQDDPVNVRARYARVARALDRIVAADPDTKVWLGPAVREFTQAAGMDARPLSSYLSILLGPGLGAWADPRIDRATATTTKGFSFAGMRRRPATLYLGVGVNDMAGLGQLMRVMFEQAILALQDGPEAASGSADTGAADTGPGDSAGAADTGAADGRGTVTLMLDEFPQLGAMSVLLGAIRTLRAYGGRVVIIVQALPDLAAIYGPEGAGLLRNNCGVQVYTAPADIETARAVSAALGERGVVSRSAALSGPLGTGGGHTASETAVSVPLMRPDEVLRLPGDDLIVLVRRKSPARLARIAWFRDPPFRDLRPGDGPCDGSGPGGETGSSRARAMRWQRAVRRIRTFAGQAFADSLPLPLAGAVCGILAFVLWQVWQDGPASLATVAGQARAWLSGGETPPAAALAAEAMDWAAIGLLTGCAGAILRVAWLDRWFMRRAAPAGATGAAGATSTAAADQGEDTETVETGAGAGEAGAEDVGGETCAGVPHAGADAPFEPPAGTDAPGASAEADAAAGAVAPVGVVVVAGDRDWEDVATAEEWLDRARAALRARYGAAMVLCHGGAAAGPDAIAAHWAQARGVPQLVAGADRGGGGAGDEPGAPAPDAMLAAFAAAEGAGPVRGVIGFGGSEHVLAFLRAAADRGLRSVHVPEGGGEPADRRDGDGATATAVAAGEGEGLLADERGTQGEAGAGGVEVVQQDGAATEAVGQFAGDVAGADDPCPSESGGDDAGGEGDTGPVPDAKGGAARDGLPVLANPPGPDATHMAIVAALGLIPDHVRPTTDEVAAWLGWIPDGAKCPERLVRRLRPAFRAARRTSTQTGPRGAREYRWVFTGKPDQDNGKDHDG